jgi:hypothetical protein
LFTNKQKQIKRTEENHLLTRCVQPVFSLPASFVGLLRSSSSLLTPYICAILNGCVSSIRMKDAQLEPKM